MKLHLYILCGHTGACMRSLGLREHPQDVTRSAFKRLRDFLKVRVSLAYYNAANAVWCGAVKVTSQPSSQSRAPA